MKHLSSRWDRYLSGSEHTGESSREGIPNHMLILSSGTRNRDHQQQSAQPGSNLDDEHSATHLELLPFCTGTCQHCA